MNGVRVKSDLHSLPHIQASSGIRARQKTSAVRQFQCDDLFVSGVFHKPDLGGHIAIANRHEFRSHTQHKRAAAQIVGKLVAVDLDAMTGKQEPRPSTWPSSWFMDGVPMKLATKRLAGRL